MVTKSKLKMALAAEKGTDFKKLKLKKKERVTIKKKGSRNGGAGAGKTISGEGDWEDLDEEEEHDDDDEKLLEDQLELNGDGEGLSGSEDGIDEESAMKIDFAALDESDSDSSAGDNDRADENTNSEASDDEDIPISDIEDLSDAEKEDLIPHQRLTINNTVALTAALKRIALPTHKLPFSEHQSLTTAAPVTIPDVSDDLARELALYSQCLESAKEGRRLLRAEGVAFTRPNDYFAEMVKADEHMGRIKAKLVEEAAGKKASAEARKQRDLKKFGKQVQVAKLQEREKEKRSTLEKIKVLKRKRQGESSTATNEADLFDVAVDEEISTSRGGSKDHRPNKRSKKDEKYGHGGKKRFKKSGDAMSSGDLSGFSSKRMKSGGVERGRGGGGAGKGKSSRPGKARRAGKR